MSSYRVPRGWIQSPRRGYIIADLFFPMKTVLDERYTDLIPEANTFNVGFLTDQADMYRIVLVIDLIDSEQYYKSKDMTDVLQIKITVPGVEALPTSKQITAFTKIVNKNIELDKEGKIAVHCIHGYNLTGFMIVNYLVTQRGIPLNEALELFAKSRPPGIYNPVFLKYLLNLHQPNLPIHYPNPPEWEFTLPPESSLQFKYEKKQTRKKEIVCKEDRELKTTMDLLEDRSRDRSNDQSVDKSHQIEDRSRDRNRVEDRSRDRRKDWSRDRCADRSRDQREDRSRERSDLSRNRRDDRSRNRRDDRSRNRRDDRSRNRFEDRSRDRSNDQWVDKSHYPREDRSRDRSVGLSRNRLEDRSRDRRKDGSRENCADRPRDQREDRSRDRSEDLSINIKDDESRNKLEDKSSEICENKSMPSLDYNYDSQTIMFDEVEDENECQAQILTDRTDQEEDKSREKREDTPKDLQSINFDEVEEEDKCQAQSLTDRQDETQDISRPILEHSPVIGNKRSSALLEDSVAMGSLKKRRIDDKSCEPECKLEIKPKIGVETPEFLVNIKDEKNLFKLREALQNVLQTTMHGFVGHKYKLVTRKVYKHFMSNQYYHTWRTNGKRYLMFIVNENHIYMIDEQNKYFKVENLNFPHPHHKGKFLIDTIIDGELVAETIASKKYYVFLISDIYALSGSRIYQESYSRRLDMIQEFIMDVRKEKIDSQIPRGPFDIMMKTISESNDLFKTWIELKKTIPHEMTGLIFYPYRSFSYTFLGRATIYIWMPTFYRYIKFKLKAVINQKNKKWIGLLYAYGASMPFTKIKYLNSHEKEKYDGKIVRCYLSKGLWKINYNHDPNDTIPTSKWDVDEEAQDWKNPISFKELTPRY